MTVRRSARIGVALVVALVLGAAAPAVAAEAGTLTVTPSTDLVDDQVVQVTGHDWSSVPFLIIAQCDARATGFGGCDQTAVTFVEAPQGSFTVDLEVERQITSRHYGTVDCASAPGACIVAALYRPTRVLASAPISFDPEGPAPDPPFQLDVDVARDVRVAPDGRRALVEVRVTCEPGMHLEVFVEVGQENGEDDARGFGGTFVHRCHGTITLEIEVHASDGAFAPGHGVIMANSLGFRDFDEPEEFAEDFELVRATFGR